VINGVDNSATTLSGIGAPLAIDLSINKIYVGGNGPDTIGVLDGATNKATLVRTGQTPAWIGVNQNSHLAYVSNMDGNTVTVVNPTYKRHLGRDFVGDGMADILWRNSSTGENGMWLMNGSSIASFAQLYQISDQNWQIAATGDFDGDGKSDILWRNSSTGQMGIWFMNGLSFSAVNPPQMATAKPTFCGVTR